MKKIILIASSLALLAGCDRTEKSESRRKVDAWVKSVTEERPSTPESRKKAEEWIKAHTGVLEEEKHENRNENSAG
jgi:hypothetical protein